MTMYNIDKLQALKKQYLEEILDETDAHDSYVSAFINSFLEFIKEKENPFNPDQTVLKFDPDGKH